MGNKTHYYISIRKDIRASERITGFSHTLNNLEFLKFKEVSFWEYTKYCVTQDIISFVLSIERFLKGDN